MFKVIAEISGDETIFYFKESETKPGFWEATDDFWGEKITLNISEQEKEEIAISSGITTPSAIILERFYEKYSDYLEQVKAGLEPIEEEDKSNLQPYDPDQIKVRRESFSVFEVNRMMTDKNDIDLNPDFQRNFVWDNARKSALIESILLGIPLPVFYFAESKSGMYHVIDGLQRLSTIKSYLRNEFPLTRLEHLQDECEGRFYIEDVKNPKIKDKYLERKYSRRLENAQLVVYVIESTSPGKVKYDIFKRINTGGRPLNHQEVRNCIADNTVRKYLKRLASSKEFLSATGGSVSDSRMDAQELVLRFTGFKMEHDGEVIYNGDMNDFLDTVLDKLNKVSNSRLKEYENAFLSSMRINFHLFGEFCFRKCLTVHLKPGARKQFINKALFVTWSIEVLKLKDTEELIKAKIPFGAFANKLAKELDNRSKYYTILTTGTSDKQNLKDASAFAHKLLSNNNIV